MAPGILKKGISYHEGIPSCPGTVHYIEERNMIIACKTFSRCIGFNLQLTTNEVHPTCLRADHKKHGS